MKHAVDLCIKYESYNKVHYELQNLLFVLYNRIFAREIKAIFNCKPHGLKEGS